MKNLDSTIYLKSKIENLEPIVDFSYKWSLNSGLDKKASIEFTLAINELITDIILFAFDNHEKEFKLSFLNNISYLEFIAYELGEPFEPDRHRYNKSNVLKSMNFEGAGLEIIKNLTDSFVFINKGRDGKEFRLVKNVKQNHIVDIINKNDLKEDEKIGQKFKIIPITNKYAEDISKLMYKAYGYSYVKEDLYYPDRVISFIDRGEKFGVIALNEYKIACGCFSVIMAKDSNIGEVGEAVVSPLYRGKGIMKLMMNGLIKISKQRNLSGIFGEAVTIHQVSQKVNYSFNFKSTAILLGMYPSMKYKGFEIKDKRISVVIDFLFLKKNDTKNLFLPKRYKSILKEIYFNAGIKVKDLRISKVNLKSNSLLELDISYKFGFSQIVVKKFGKDFMDIIKNKVNSLKENGIKVVYIDLPLELKYTKIITEELNKLGFIFSGLVPLFHNEKDYLRLQKIFDILNLEYVNVYSKMSKKIKNQIIRDMEKE